MVEETSIFDEAEVTEVLQEEGSQEDEEVSQEWKPVVMSESPKDRLERKGQKINANGRILTIKSWSFTKPKMKTPEGETIAPKVTQSGKQFYPGKLVLHFVEDNIIEYYPTIRYFVNDGKLSNVAKLNRQGDSCIAQIVRLVVAEMGKSLEDCNDLEILNFLNGKQVKIVTKTGQFNGKAWYRNDLEKFV